MKILRILLRSLIVACALVVLLAVIELFPNAQTWTVDLFFAARPQLKGSLDELAAGFGRVEIYNLKLTAGGAAITLPRLRASLPVTRALLTRNLRIRSLVAKGWTIDFTHGADAVPANSPAEGQATPAPSAPPGSPPVPPAPPAPAPSVAVPPESPARIEAAVAGAAARVIHQVLHRWDLPCAGTLDGVDLEGDVLTLPSPGAPPIRVHVVITGGGLAPGHDGTFKVAVSTDVVNSQDQDTYLNANGDVRVGLIPPRTVGRTDFRGDLSAAGGPFPNRFTVATDIAVVRHAGGATISVSLQRTAGDQAAVTARYAADGRRFEGTWKLALQDSDLAPFLPNATLPPFAARGAGRFDADAALADIRAVGRLEGRVGALGVYWPALERLGTVTVAADFEATQSGVSLRLTRLDATIGGTGPTARVRMLQPFTFDEAGLKLVPSAPANEWANVSIRGFPTGWLPALPGGFALSGGTGVGDVVVRGYEGGFALHTQTPLRIAGVDLTRSGRVFGRHLDLALSLSARHGPKGWHLESNPLTIASGGDRLADLTLNVTRPAAADAPTALAGTWKADLAAPSLVAAIPDFRGLGGRSAAGSFSATLAPASAKFDAKLTAVGRDSHRSLSAGIQGTSDLNGRVDFKAPLQIATGPQHSDFSMQGTLIHDDSGRHLYLKLKGKDAVLAHLRLLGGAAEALEGVPLPFAIKAPRTGRRDQTPFWGRWNGRVLMEFDRMQAGDLTFSNVAAALQIDPHTIHLSEGRGALAGRSLEQVSGSLAFDPKAAEPYRLSAAAKFAPFEVGSFFPSVEPTRSPLLEGRFTVAADVSGRGADLAELIQRTRVEAKLSSDAGIVRLFRTNVDEAIPEETTSAATDTAERLGYAVGGFFGMQSNSFAGEKTISPALQDALNVVNQTAEIGYDRLTLTVVREPDQTVRLLDLEVTAGDEHATGSGRIAFVKGVPLRSRPLHLELHLAARGWDANLMKAAGLLSTRKDAKGFTLLKQPLTIGGTLAHPDNHQWHEWLLESARRKLPPPKGKKRS